MGSLDSVTMNEVSSGNHKQLVRFLGLCEKAHRTPMIWGSPGIGKSEVVLEYGKNRAEQMGREFVIWHELTSEQKKAMFYNESLRGNSYILHDNRAASNDSTDDKGIPSLAEEDYLCWKQNLIYMVFEKENAAGIQFNDEINLAPTIVQNSMYKMVYNRSVGEIAFNDDVFIVCAGNRAQDQAFVQETPLPLRTRLIHFQLRAADAEDQINWFIENDVDPRLVGFFAKNPDKLNTEFASNTAEFTANRPRSVVMCSDLIKNLDFHKDKEDIRMCACGAMSDMVGNLFITFMEGWGSIDLDKYLDKPKLLKELENNIDAKYGVITLAVNRFKNTTKGKKALLHKIADMWEYLDPELGTIMLRLVKNTTRPADFIDYISQHKNWSSIAPKINPYIGG